MLLAMKTVSPDARRMPESATPGLKAEVFATLEVLEDTLEKAIHREANNEVLLTQIEGDIKRAAFDIEHGLSARIRTNAAAELKLLRRVRRNTLAEQAKLDEWIDAMFEYWDLLHRAIPIH
jgi:hypothetical protein